MNFRYDAKQRPVAPQGRPAQMAVKNIHKVLDGMMQQQAAGQNELFGELNALASSLQEKTTVSPATERKIKSYEAKTQRLLQHRLLQTMDYSFDFCQIVFLPVNNDTQFLTLPFDSEWSTIMGNANRNTGEMSLGTMAGGDITIGTGLGLFLTSPKPVSAYVRALMSMDYLWGHAIFDHGFTASIGTVGILVYETGSAEIVADKRATLWNEAMWMSSTTTRQGEDRVYLTQTKAAEVSFYMSSGKKYQVWFWLNINLRTVGLSIASAVIRAKCPLVFLNTFPLPKVN